MRLSTRATAVCVCSGGRNGEDLPMHPTKVALYVLDCEGCACRKGAFGDSQPSVRSNTSRFFQTPRLLCTSTAFELNWYRTARRGSQRKHPRWRYRAAPLRPRPLATWTTNKLGDPSSQRRGWKISPQRPSCYRHRTPERGKTKGGIGQTLVRILSQLTICCRLLLGSARRGYTSLVSSTQFGQPGLQEQASCNRKQQIITSSTLKSKARGDLREWPERCLKQIQGDRSLRRALGDCPQKPARH